MSPRTRSQGPIGPARREESERAAARPHLVAGGSAGRGCGARTSALRAWQRPRLGERLTPGVERDSEAPGPGPAAPHLRAAADSGTVPRPAGSGRGGWGGWGSNPRGSPFDSPSETFSGRRPGVRRTKPGRRPGVRRTKPGMAHGGCSPRLDGAMQHATMQRARSRPDAQRRSRAPAPPAPSTAASSERRAAGGGPVDGRAGRLRFAPAACGCAAAGPTGSPDLTEGRADSPRG